MDLLRVLLSDVGNGHLHYHDYCTRHRGIDCLVMGQVRSTEVSSTSHGRLSCHGPEQYVVLCIDLKSGKNNFNRLLNNFNIFFEIRNKNFNKNGSDYINLAWNQLKHFSGIFPAFHLLFTDGWTSMIDNSSFHWLLIMGALYIMGATIYATRFPERCFPGRCDYFVGVFQPFYYSIIGRSSFTVIPFYSVTLISSFTSSLLWQRSFTFTASPRWR